MFSAAQIRLRRQQGGNSHIEKKPIFKPFNNRYSKCSVAVSEGDKTALWIMVE